MDWTKGRGVGLALVLAVAPACASGVGFGDEAGTEQGSGTMVTGTTQPTGADPTGADSTTGPDPTTSTTADPTTDGTSTGDDTTTGDDSTTGEELPHPELYPVDRTHSPISAYVADNIRTIAANPAGADKNAQVFAKIGGTVPASGNFMRCFAVEGEIQDLPPDPGLATTIAHFLGVDLGGATSFDRPSVAAMAGFGTDELLAGMPSPVAAEVEAIKPRFAHVLAGTHDLEKTQPAQLWLFADQLLDLVDGLIAGGVVPILSTLPQRTDLPDKDLYVPRYNAVVRAVAQGRQIPLLNLHRELAALPMLGLLDGVDLTVFNSAMVDRPCHFNEVALMSGHNRYNLEGLVALDRARQVVVDAVPELDPATPGLAGTGTPDDPILIPSLPFVDLRSTADSPSDAIDTYLGACDQTKDESGPERIYKLTVEANINIRVMVFDRGAVDVDVQVLSDANAATCLKRDDREVAGMVPPGTYYISIDSFAGTVPEGASGEYMLVVVAD